MSRREVRGEFDDGGSVSPIVCDSGKERDERSLADFVALTVDDPIEHPLRVRRGTTAERFDPPLVVSALAETLDVSSQVAGHPEVPRRS